MIQLKDKDWQMKDTENLIKLLSRDYFKHKDTECLTVISL